MIALPYKIEGFNPMSPGHWPLVAALPRKGSKRTVYLEDPVLLDTETSNNYDPETGTGCGWIYQWAFNFGDMDCIGTYTSELIVDLMNATARSIEQAKAEDHDLDVKCLVFVHNLSYDIQYLKNWLMEIFPDFKILAVQPHKFITFSCGPFEFRCTYKLANRSLAKWGKDLGIRHKKKSGLIDYHVRRYPDEPRTYDDWLYMLYDIWALRDCVYKQMEIYGDNVASIPLTSTGYIRREARKNYKKDLRSNRRFFLRSRMTTEVYKALKLAGAGGITQGNRIFEDVRVDVDEIWNKRPDAFERDEPIRKIKHVDFRSHYPTQQAASDEIYGFPQDKFSLYFRYTVGGKRLHDWHIIDRLSKTHCLLLEICIKDPEILPGITLPYLQSAKAVQGRIGSYKVDEDGNLKWRGFMVEVEDNGRILKASGWCRLFLTEWDLKWLRKQYKFEYEIKTIWKSPRGAIPRYLRDTVDEFFIQKSELKGELKHLEEIKADEWKIIDARINLMKSKNGLNGIFGMCFTDPVRQELTMSEGGEWDIEEKTDEMIDRKLNGWDDENGEHHKGYYESFNSFMIYAIGVYVTALARNELMEAVETIGYKYYLYCDTDSVFFIENDETAHRFRALNEYRRIRAEKIGAFVTLKDGTTVQYDVLEEEKENITSFRFIHAKAYAYITDGGTKDEELHCTIAGVSEYSPDYVPKRKISEFRHNGRTYQIWKRQKGISRVQELGDIDQLHHGKKFTRCGGTKIAYLEDKPHEAIIDGHRVEVASSAIISENTKTLSGPIAKNEVWWIWKGAAEVTY